MALDYKFHQKLDSRDALIRLGLTGQTGEEQMLDVEQEVRERCEKRHKGQEGTGMVAKPKRKPLAQESQELSRKQLKRLDCYLRQIDPGSRIPAFLTEN